MNEHPANNNKVRLSIWIDETMRDYVRIRAQEAGKTVSEWACEAFRQAVLNASIAVLRFPPEAPK